MTTTSPEAPQTGSRTDHDLLREIFELAPTFLAVVRGPDHVFDRANAAYLRLVGQRELVGRSVRDAMPEVVGQGFLEILDDVYRSGEPFVANELPIRLNRNGGPPEERFVSFVYQPIRNDEGDVECIMAHGVDVTDHVKAREELAGREAFYRSLLENSQDKVTVLAADGTIRYESPAVRPMLGWSVDDLVGRNIMEFIHPDDTDVAVEHMTTAVGDPGVAHRVELRVRREDGTWAGLEVVGQARQSHYGVEIVVNSRDITERRAAADRLREREQRFRALVELIPQLVWSTTPDGYHDYFNQRWYDYTGMTPGDGQGWNWTDYLHPDDYDRSAEVWKHSLDTGEPYEIEYRFRSRDGDYRWFIGRALPLYDESGAIMRWFGTCTDVHDERQALDAAHEMKDRFTAVTRATNDVIWDWDLTTGRLWHNENVRSVLRMSAGEIPDIDSWEQRIHVSDRARVRSSIDAALHAGDEVWTDEYRFVRGDGSIAHILDRGLVTRDAAGNAVRMVGSMLDMTARMQLEEDLRQAQKLDAVGRLAGGIAHDFNNVLTVITSYSEIMLADMPEGTPARSDIGEIRKAAMRASSLTRQLLAFSRRQLLQPRELDLNATVTDMESMLRRVIGENLLLVARPGADLCAVLADPGQVEQIILNLVLNARDAMSDGGTITVSTGNASVDVDDARRAGIEPGDYVFLVIEDTGEGMTQEVLEQAFEPFFTTKASGRGTGLGLSTVHGIVRQSGGSIDIVSRPGAGTRVRVMLPATTATTAASPEPAIPTAPAATADSRGRILLVEDEDALRTITRRCLVRAGYSVIEARNGVEALNLVESHDGEIDMILTDLVMPELGGRELAARVRERNAPPPVLYMSGYAEEDVLPRDELARGATLLEKPFTVAALISAVSATLSVA